MSQARGVCNETKERDTKFGETTFLPGVSIMHGCAHAHTHTHTHTHTYTHTHPGALPAFGKTHAKCQKPMRPEILWTSR